MPKKDQDQPPKVSLLGRPSNNVKIGIVGLPNVGKSSFFNELSKLNVAAENYPFCTIEPNTARVPVPDRRFDVLVASYKPKSVVPAVLTITDIAGLVRGASEGKGLGNAFLSHIRACDAIYEVVRCFADKEVTHVEGSIDPARDIDIIREELLKKDQEAIAKALDGMEKLVSRGVGGKEKKLEYEALKKIEECLNNNIEIRAGKWTAYEIDLLNQLQLLTAKPVIYLCNMSEKAYLAKRCKWLDPVREKVKSLGLDEHIIPFSVSFESHLLSMSPEEAKAFCEEHKVKSVLPKIIVQGYHTLNLIHFFTAGADEVKSWTIKRGTLAPQAAGVIHTDFEKGFICAEVHKFDDFETYKTEAAVRAAGKLLQEGRKYEVQDGDIIYFKFNAPNEGKKK